MKFSGSGKNLTLLVLRLLDKLQFDIFFSESKVILIRPADTVFCH